LETTNPTEKELKKAFREASRKYHPDKNTGGEDTTEQFLQLKHA
jgi:DnaJ-class molecular chaperone